MRRTILVLALLVAGCPEPADPDPGETDPKNPDTDGDGLTDGWVDKNKNGKWDKGEGEDKNNNGKRDIGETDPLVGALFGGVLHVAGPVE